MQELAAASIQESGSEHVSQRALHVLRILSLSGKEMMMVNREPYNYLHFSQNIGRIVLLEGLRV